MRRITDEEREQLISFMNGEKLTEAQFRNLTTRRYIIKGQVNPNNNTEDHIECPVVYKITNLINGKIYVGKDAFNRPSYLGSGILIQKAIADTGEEFFERTILEYCASVRHAYQREAVWIRDLKSQDPLIGYNIANGGTQTEAFIPKPGNNNASMSNTFDPEAPITRKNMLYFLNRRYGRWAEAAEFIMEIWGLVDKYDERTYECFRYIESMTEKNEKDRHK